MPQIGDVAVVPAKTAPECTPAQNDAAVCVALRWAQRTTGATVPDVADVCAVLGLDLSGALQRARDER